MGGSVDVRGRGWDSAQSGSSEPPLVDLRLCLLLCLLKLLRLWLLVMHWDCPERGCCIVLVEEGKSRHTKNDVLWIGQHAGGLPCKCRETTRERGGGNDA